MCQPQRRQMIIHQGNMLNIMGIGVRRASSFMALGVRVADDQAVDSVTLDGNFQIQFMPDATIEQVREAQQNFKSWIVGNGLRELDQAASLFADSVFRALTLAGFHERPITQDALDQIDRFKRDTNVAAKLSNIAEAFGADTDLRMHMPGLSKARNALTHNMGFVGPLHCTHPGELQLSWIGPEIEIGGRVAGADFEPIVVEQAQKVLFRFAPRARNIAVGRPIELSPHDLHEICLTYWFQATKLIAEVNRVLADWGIGPAREEVPN